MTALRQAVTDAAIAVLGMLLSSVAIFGGAGFLIVIAVWVAN